MRTFLSSLFFILTFGCASEANWIQHASMIETRSRGVEFTGDGNFADIGMVGNTCRFDFKAGTIGSDVDIIQGEDDVIQDALDSRVVIKGATGVHIVDDWLQNPATPEMQGRGVVVTKLTNTSYVTVASDGDGCAVTWEDGRVQRLSGGCPDSSSVSVDRSNGSVFLATESGTFAVTPDGLHDLNVDSSMLAWSDATETLYTARQDSSVITSVGLDGFTKWSVDVGATVTSLDDLAFSGGIVVMVGDSEGGEILVLDGETGSVRERTPTPTAADRILTSPTGDTLAVVIESEIHFFSINTSF